MADACFNSIRKMVNIASMSYFMGTLLVCKCFIVMSLQTPISDCTLSLTPCLWHYSRNDVEVVAFRSGELSLICSEMFG